MLVKIKNGCNEVIWTCSIDTLDVDSLSDTDIETFRNGIIKTLEIALEKAKCRLFEDNMEIC